MNSVQHVIVFVVLAAAVGYAAWHTYKAFKQPDDPCAGCDGCALKELKQQNKTACDKKLHKKFGSTK